MMHSLGKGKLVLALMIIVICARLSLFALSTMGIIPLAGPLNNSIISWVLPLLMVGVMIFMLLFMRGRMMGRMACGLDNATPLEILKRRFALGEITKDQYEDMRRVLLDDEDSRESA